MVIEDGRGSGAPPEACQGPARRPTMPANLPVKCKGGGNGQSYTGSARGVRARRCGHRRAGLAQTTLRVVKHSDLKILDPVWTTAYIVRNHGYMIYDTLFAHGRQPRGQAADGRQVDDLRTTSSPGPSRCATGWNCTTARRSPARTSSPRSSAGRCAIPWARSCGPRSSTIKAVDPKTFQILLKAPTGIVLEALGKPSSIVPFIMPKRVAETDPFKQIEDYTGSGPFIFVKDEWKPGDKTVYVKNPKYKPRPEPASNLAGGKLAKVDRVEWMAIPDQQTAMNALLQGRDRHDRDAAARPLQGHGSRSQHQAVQRQQVGQPVHLPLQPAASSRSTTPRSARPRSTPSTRRTFSTA